MCNIDNNFSIAFNALVRAGTDAAYENMVDIFNDDPKNFIPTKQFLIDSALEHLYVCLPERISEEMEPFPQELLDKYRQANGTVDYFKVMVEMKIIELVNNHSKYATCQFKID